MLNYVFKSFSFSNLNFKKLFRPFFVVNLTFSILFLVLGYSSGLLVPNIFDVLLAQPYLLVFIILIFVFISDFTTVLMYKVMDNMKNNKEENLFNLAMSFSIPFLKLGFLILLMNSIFLGLSVFMLYLFIQKIISLLILILALLSLIPLFLIVKFLLQFSLIELSLNKKSPLESIKSSIIINRKNIWKVFCFSVVYWFLTFGSFFGFGINADFLAPYISNTLTLAVLDTIISSFFLTMAQMYLYVGVPYFFWSSIRESK